MLKTKIDRNAPGAKISVEAEGTVDEIVDDIGNVVIAIYNDIKSRDPECATELKIGLQEIFADDGPAWKSPEEPKKAGNVE